MTLNKKKMVREIGRRTRLKNKDVETVIKALEELWVETFVNGEAIELQGIVKLSIRTCNRYHSVKKQLLLCPRIYARTGNRMKTLLRK